MLFPFAIRGGHAASPNIEQILHPIFIPLVLLSKRNLQYLAFLLPLRHEGTTAILGNKLIFVDLLGSSLKLIIFTECANVWLLTIRQTGPTKLAQSEDTIWSEMMQLYLKSLQAVAKKPCGREAKTAGKEVMKHDDISSL
jgi:hypothetical protein